MASEVTEIKKPKASKKGKAEKTKPAAEKEKAAATYPVKLFLNEYGFVRIANALRADLGWGTTANKEKGINGSKVSLTAEKDAQGNLIIRRA